MKRLGSTNFACVAVKSLLGSAVRHAFEGSGVSVCTGIGFPLGAHGYRNQVEEAKLAIAQGASEDDVVINIGKAKEGDWKAVQEELMAVAAVAKPLATMKVILETCYLTDAEKIEVCKAALACGADYVKTSTGFGTAGATIEDVKLMRSTVGTKMKVKASGGIKTLVDAICTASMPARHALGTSNGVIDYGRVRSPHKVLSFKGS